MATPTSREASLAHQHLVLSSSPRQQLAGIRSHLRSQHSQRPPAFFSCCSCSRLRFFPEFALAHVVFLVHVTSRQYGGVWGDGGADNLLSFDFSLDLIVYSLLTLAAATWTCWKRLCKLFRTKPARRAALTAAVAVAAHVLREVLVIKVREDENGTRAVFCPCFAHLHSLCWRLETRVGHD